MLTPLIYPIFQTLIIAVVMVIVILMTLRLIFNYTDPNPFGAVGRFAYHLKKFTDRIVDPSAMFLARLRINPKIAPLVTIFAFCIFGYFILEFVSIVLTTIDGITLSAAAGNLVHLVGYLLVGLLGGYSLLIVVRIVFSWFMDWSSRLMRFLRRVTDPILEPFRRLIPPLGMFDISPIVVLFILHFLRIAVAGVLLR
jgi:Predicted integral membrane protein